MGIPSGSEGKEFACNEGDSGGACVFPGGSDSKEFACNEGDLGLISGSGRSPGEEKGYPPQYSCLESSMAQEPWPQSMGSQRVGHDWVTNTSLFRASSLCLFLGQSELTQPTAAAAGPCCQELRLHLSSGFPSSMGCSHLVVSLTVTVTAGFQPPGSMKTTDRAWPLFRDWRWNSHGSLWLTPQQAKNQLCTPASLWG